MKKYGGLIKNWQLHTLSVPIEEARKTYPQIETDKVYRFSGTVMVDPLGKWEQGHHMTSSLVVRIDRDKGEIETLNTIYRVCEEGNDIFPDIGDVINSVFY